jgi:argininosuccinate lyase
MARDLGFKEITQNSIDAVSDRDFIAEMLFNISLTAVHLSRISEEFIIWSSTQFNYLELPEELCTGSSIMPQKKKSRHGRIGSGRCSANHWESYGAFKFGEKPTAGLQPRQPRR